MHPVEHHRWWTAKGDDDVAGAVIAAAEAVDYATTERQDDILTAMALYGTNTYRLGAAAVDYVVPFHRRTSENFLASFTDAFVAQLMQEKPRTMLTTVSGSWDDQTRAKRLTHYCDVRGQELRKHKLLSMCARDSYVCGLGAIKVYPDFHRRRVWAERVNPLSLFVDDIGAIDTDPRVLFQRHVIDRTLLAACYPNPKHREDIMLAHEPDYERHALAVAFADSVEVWEAWRLPSTPYDDKDPKKWEKSTDGRHCIVLRGGSGSGTVLFDEPWKRERFPFVFMRLFPAQTGWWGEQGMLRGASQQHEHNRLNRRIVEAQNLISVPRVFARPGTVKAAKMKNNIGIIVECDEPPTFHTAQAMPADAYARLESLPSSAARAMGVSEDFAQSTIPSALASSGSGRSQLVFHDFRTRRHVEPARELQDTGVEFDRHLIECERQLADWLKEEHGITHKVTIKRAGGEASVNWGDVDLGRDKLRIQTFGGSNLPTEPAARVKFLQELMSTGVIDMPMFWSALDIADFESAREWHTTPFELLKMRLDGMLEDGVYASPEPYLNLELAVKLSVVQMQRGQIYGAPESRIELVRRFYRASLDMLKKAQPPAPPEPIMPPAGPMPPPPGEVIAPPGAPIPPPGPEGLAVPPGPLPGMAA